MNERQHYSDEILNAFVDGELDVKERERINQAMENDEILRRRVNDLRQVGELVRAAYQNERPASINGGLPGYRPGFWPVAAMIGMLGLGSLFGWHIYQHETAGPSSLVASSTIHETLAQLQPPESALRILFHVGREDPALLQRVLAETETLLSAPDDATRPLFVKVVASHGGLSLFRIGAAESAQWISRLKRQFDDHVAFVGCGETYDQWNMESKQAPKLIPEMIMVDSGVSELLRRQKQGWSYIRI